MGGRARERRDPRPSDAARRAGGVGVRSRALPAPSRLRALPRRREDARLERRLRRRRRALPRRSEVRPLSRGDVVRLGRRPRRRRGAPLQPLSRRVAARRLARAQHRGRAEGRSLLVAAPAASGRVRAVDARLRGGPFGIGGECRARRRRLRSPPRRERRSPLDGRARPPLVREPLSAARRARRRVHDRRGRARLPQPRHHRRRGRRRGEGDLRQTRRRARLRGSDPHLWNVACDFVINGWLMEMGFAEMPEFGGLYDAELRGLSAEAVYERLATDMRRHRKLATFAGHGACDMIGTPDWWARQDATSLDDFYRRALGHGLVYHQDEGRGLLPAALLEEIRALDRPPMPWDVELAQWFDEHFPPLARVRTDARLTRRQSSPPDIPRPRHVPAPEDANRTFGVVLDTSGSMDRTLLAKCLGTIASYCAAREVRRVRLVFCDAAAYDQGYVAAEEIGGRVTVKGRGGTVLQPGIDLIEKAQDFPATGPILVITDGACDRVRIRREHAFLLPQGRSLPFVARGKVFAVK